MGQTNDCRFAELVRRGYSGSSNDMLFDWLQANVTGTPKAQTINDAWHQFYDERLVPSGVLNDRHYEYLSSLVGSPGGDLSEMWEWFWCTYLPSVP